MTTMTTSEVLIDHQKVKDLVAKSKRLPKDAWKLGEILLTIKDKNKYEEKQYKTFEEYVKNFLNISAQTAYKYIKIRKAFQNPKEIPDFFLITHIDYILNHIENAEDVNIIVSKINECLIGKNKDNQSTSQTSLKFEQETKLDQELIYYIVNQIVEVQKIIKKENSPLVESKIKLENLSIKENIDLIVNKSVQERKYGRKIHPPTQGSRIKIPPLCNLMTYEPSREAEVVALFFLMFSFWKDNKYEMVIDNKCLCLSQVELVQTNFPDARIGLIEKKHIKLGKNTIKKYNVEFEFESNNYLKHKHTKQQSQTELTLIICWNHNAIAISNPVIELRTTLEKNHFVVY
jgi:hypothetical protein